MPKCKFSPCFLLEIKLHRFLFFCALSTVTENPLDLDNHIGRAESFVYIYLLAILQTSASLCTISYETLQYSGQRYGLSVSQALLAFCYSFINFIIINLVNFIITNLVWNVLFINPMHNNAY